MKKILNLILLYILCTGFVCAQDLTIDSKKFSRNLTEQNIISKQTTSEEILEKYTEKIQAEIIRNWEPKDIDKPYEITLALTVRTDGSLTNSKIINSTGSAEANDAVLEAAIKSSPFEEIKGIENLHSVQIQITLANKIVTRNVQKYSSENPEFAIKPVRHVNGTGDFDLIKANDSYVMKPLPANSADLKEYTEKLDKKIKKYWNPSQNMPKPVTVKLKIAKDGTLLSTEFKEASKLQSINKYILKTIEKALPYDKLPNSYAGDYIETDLIFHYEASSVYDYF